jgi:NACHT domain
MDMCRFRGPQDQGYVKARDAISLHVESVKKDLSSKGRDLNDTKTDRQSPAKEVVSSTHSESVTTLANASQQTLQRDLARSLYFGDIGARKSQIYTDSSEVNSWIWSNDHPGQNFPDWLSGPQNLYWIQGKAGSGKSTLVKYITQHENLERCLSEVDNGRSWKVVSFYFDFRARRGLANNFEGLLRSLLLQLIRQAPDLATEITPFGMDELDVDFCLRWNVAALRPALRATLSTKSNICIFVDGLDEYEGNYLDLVDFFKEVEEIGQSSRNPSIKLCLASRPEPLLLEHLRHCGSLKMQECNYESISVYVSKRLQDIVHSGPGPDAQGLINGVAERSEGVFLWATHVVDELLDAWSCGDTLEDLEQRLSDLPPDLEDMFARMLNRVKPAHVHEASIMLRLTCYAKDNLTLEQLLTSVMLAKGSPLSKYPKSDPRMAFEMQRRVAAYTRGLLESRTGEERMMEWISANVPVNARSSSFTDLQEDSNEKINPSALSDRSLGENILKSEVRLVHKSFRTYLERPGWLSTFLTNRAPELYHGEELWLRVCVAYLQLARNAMPQHVDDIDRSLSSQLLDHSASLHKYVYSHLETHAAAFEAQTKQSSYPLLHSFFSDNNFMNYFDLDDHLFKGQNSITSLSIAASRGLELYVREEVSLGEIDITARSGRALLAALQRKEESIIEYFLSSSVPVEDVHIIRALQNLPPRIVETLLKRRSKGDLWLKDETGEQVTPLYVLAHQNCKMYKPLVQFFINHGEGINAVSGPCGTALHASLVTSQSLEKVEFLISKGADVNADGPIGTPLEIAWKWHFYKVDALPLLIRYGATSD